MVRNLRLPRCSTLLIPGPSCACQTPVTTVRAYIFCLLFAVVAATAVQADPPHARFDLKQPEPELGHGNAVPLVPESNSGDTVNDFASLALLDAEILFGRGDYELTPEGKDSLERLIIKLEQFDAILSIRIVGHTDNVGTTSYNQGLSTRRADWIKAHFSHKYPNAHMLALGTGETAPKFSNSTDYGRSRNRRVEVQVIATGKAPFDR